MAKIIVAIPKQLIAICAAIAPADADVSHKTPPATPPMHAQPATQAARRARASRRPSSAATLERGIPIPLCWSDPKRQVAFPGPSFPSSTLREQERTQGNRAGRGDSKATAGNRNTKLGSSGGAFRETTSRNESARTAERESGVATGTA